MTDIVATVIAPASQVATARSIGAADQNNPQWRLGRALTTDPTGPSNSAAEATDYGSSGSGDAGLLALIAMLPGVIVVFSDDWQQALADNGRYIIADEI